VERLAVISSVFNEEEVIPIFFERFAKEREKLGDDLDVRLFFIDNGCVDNSLDLIRELRATHNWVNVISLSRNFGYQGALICGLQSVEADGYIVIDADCEDPPEMLPEFVKYWRKGYDVVYGLRRGRHESWILRLTRGIFYRFTRMIADADFILDMAEFALITRRVRDAVISTASTHPFVRAEIAYAGFTRKALPYDRQARPAGKTHYNFFHMSRFAIAGILTSSTFPLRAWGYFVPLLAIVGVISGLFLNASSKAFQVLIALEVGCIMIMIMICCLYVARIYKDQIQRPIYMIDERKTCFDQFVK
jgi:dolichol-phosphate mannosyltransferase|tara:strand:+ start:1322 stop:2239 length:918 start_codon:yes stop_codon:yes gene_type:complete